MQKGLIIGIILAFLMVIFTLQNPANIQIKFLFWKVPDIPVALFTILSISLGVIITLVLSYLGKDRYRSEYKQLKEENNSLKAQLEEYDQKLEAKEMISDDGMTINGNPGNNFFDS